MSEAGKTLAGAAALLAVLAVGIAVADAAGDGGPDHRRAISLAAAVAGTGALAGWLVGRMGRGHRAAIAVAASLGAVLVRLLPPLAGLAWITASEGPARRAGAAGLLVSFYLALLAADVVLTVVMDRKHRPSGGADGTI